jgi:hypothetical protein
MFKILEKYCGLEIHPNVQLKVLQRHGLDIRLIFGALSQNIM